MTQRLWQTPEDRETLLKSIVKRNTITHSQGEKEFPAFIKGKLQQLTYFQEHPDQLYLVDTEDHKQAVLAYYKAPSSKKTITLISHYDTVGIEDFSDYQESATDMDRITEIFREDPSYLTENAIKDLESGKYLFGRGSMDMKPGLMLHMSLVEKAIAEQWDINLIIMTVPDEEVNSSGMRAAVAFLSELKEKENLEIALHLNSEPTFQQETGDSNHYVYSGTIGKIMPGVLVYGRETHVGTPLNGISSNFIHSHINRLIEYNTNFEETFETEVSPLPVSLIMRDLKPHYDAQTPFRTVGLYNVFLFKNNAADIFKSFNELVQEGADHALATYKKVYNREHEDRPLDLPVYTYETFKQKAIEILGEDRVNEEIEQIIQDIPELHEQSIAIVDNLMSLCRSLSPAVITFYSPPYYPPVNNSYDDFVESLVDTVAEVSKEHFGRASKRIHYFNGICDLSYVRYEDNAANTELYSRNTPNFKHSYSIPFNAIKAISAPAFNCGPIGKDAHRVSERVHKRSAFEELPILLEAIVKQTMEY